MGDFAASPLHEWETASKMGNFAASPLHEWETASKMADFAAVKEVKELDF